MSLHGKMAGLGMFSALHRVLPNACCVTINATRDDLRFRSKKISGALKRIQLCI